MAFVKLKVVVVMVGMVVGVTVVELVVRHAMTRESDLALQPVLYFG